MSARTRPHIEHLQRRGLARVERRWDPDHGGLIQWHQMRRQRRQDMGQGHSL